MYKNGKRTDLLVKTLSVIFTNRGNNRHKYLFDFATGKRVRNIVIFPFRRLIFANLLTMHENNENETHA